VIEINQISRWRTSLVTADENWRIYPFSPGTLTKYRKSVFFVGELSYYGCQLRNLCNTLKIFIHYRFCRNTVTSQINWGPLGILRLGPSALTH